MIPLKHGTAAVRLLLLATPLFALLAPYSFIYPYVVPRAVAFRTAVLLAAGLLLLIAARRTLIPRLRQDLLFGALAVHLLVQAVSAMASPAPWNSVYGGLERMGGVISSAHLLLFYLLLRSFFDSREWTWYLRVATAAALAVAAHLFMEHVRTGAVTTLIGNPGLAGVFLLFGIGFAALGALRTHGIEQRIFSLAAVLLGGGLILTNNRSSLLGLAVGATAGLAVLALTHSPSLARLRRWRYAAALGALLLLALPVANRVNPDLRLHERLPGVFGRVSYQLMDPVRTAAWRTGVRAFAEKPLLGWGPENYHLVWSAYADRPGIQLAQHMGFDRAHNAYIDVLALSGALGGAAYLLVWLATLLLLYRAWRGGSLDPPAVAIIAGLLTGYAVFLFFWFDDVNSSVLWTALLAFIGQHATHAPALAVSEPGERRVRTPIVAGAVLAILASLYLHGFETLRLARALHVVERPGLDIEDRLDTFRYLFASPAPQSGIAAGSFLNLMNALAPSFEQIREDPYRAAVLDSAMQRGFHFMEVMQRRDPRDPHVYVTDGSLSLMALRFYRTRTYLDRAEEKLQRAVALGPGRLAPRYLLAELYRASGNHMRAIAQIDTARSWAGPSAEADYYEARIQQSAGDMLAASRLLLRALRGGYAAEIAFVSELAEHNTAAGRTATAAQMGRRALQLRVGDMHDWAAPALPGDTLTGHVRELALRLPLMVLRTGDADEAVSLATALQRRHPPAAPAAARFMTDLRAGSVAGWLALPPDAGLMADSAVSASRAAVPRAGPAR